MGDVGGVGFRKIGAPMVRWLSPQGLLATGTDVVLAGLFGRFADKRESEGTIKMGKAFPPRSYDETRDGSKRYDTEDLWFDYVADTGDGWASTYAVAWALCRSHTVADDRGETQVPPGRILIMGSDQVYPSADYDRYQRRLITPYQVAARQLPSDGSERDVFAIPGNHDWYDGLTSFMRIFGRERRFGVWHAPQRRSYFAARLPHRWWVLGIDIAFDSYLDAAQLEYFRGLVGNEECNIRPHDRVLLCTAKPVWCERDLRGDGRIAKHANGELLEDLEHEIVETWDCELPVVLSGDLHHYSRYATEDGRRHWITAAAAVRSCSRPTGWRRKSSGAQTRVVPRSISSSPTARSLRKTPRALSGSES